MDIFPLWLAADNSLPNTWVRISEAVIIVGESLRDSSKPAKMNAFDQAMMASRRATRPRMPKKSQHLGGGQFNVSEETLLPAKAPSAGRLNELHPSKSTLAL